MRARSLPLALLAELTFIAAAHAQGAAPGVPVGTRQGPPQADWTITVGAAPVVAPVWQGSRDYGLSVFPDLRVNYKDAVFLSVPDGLGWNAINRGGWKLGPLAKIRFARQESNGGSPFLLAGRSTALRGLGTVGLAGEFGGFAQYSFAANKLRARAEVRQGVGGHEGVIADTLIGFSQRQGRTIYGLSARATFASADYNNTYFGVTPAQSLRSGLPVARLGDGLVSYGVSGSIVRRLGANTSLTFIAGYERLNGVVTRSSLIRERGDPNQASVGLAFGYRFQVR